VDSTTIGGLRCSRETPGSARALSIQGPTERSSFSRPYCTSFATSQQEIMLTGENAIGAKFENFAVPGL
jgi:hypothetical protein